MVIGEMLTAICHGLIGPNYRVGHYSVRKGKKVWIGIGRRNTYKIPYYSPTVTQEVELLQIAKELGIIAE